MTSDRQQDHPVWIWTLLTVGLAAGMVVLAWVADSLTRAAESLLGPDALLVLWILAMALVAGIKIRDSRFGPEAQSEETGRDEVSEEVSEEVKRRRGLGILLGLVLIFLVVLGLNGAF